MDIKGKGVVITGGGTGIGRAIAVALAREGCKVAVGGRRLDVLEAASRDTGTAPLLYHGLDVSDRASVEKFFAWAEKALERLDILVNAAGVNVPRRRIADTTPADWDRLLDINATGAFNCMTAVLPGMRQRGDGLIVNISSISGIRAGVLGGVAYCASKFAMSALGTSVNLEDSPSGIRVSNVYPGEVDTPILEDRPTPVTEEHRARILQPEDVAAAVVMIARLPARANVPDLVIKPTLQEHS